MWRETSMASRRLSDQGEEKNGKTLWIVDVLAEMLTGHLFKISQEMYCTVLYCTVLYLWVSLFDKDPTAKLTKVIM